MCYSCSCLFVLSFFHFLILLCVGDDKFMDFQGLDYNADFITVYKIIHNSQKIKYFMCGDKKNLHYM